MADPGLEDAGVIKTSAPLLVMIKTDKKAGILAELAKFFHQLIDAFENLAQGLNKALNPRKPRFQTTERSKEGRLGEH